MSKKDKVLGSRLKKLRAMRGINQEHVAIDIGISRARYSHYENDHVEPDTQMIKRLAEYYNVTTDYLLGHEINDVDLMTDDEIDDEIREIAKQIDVWFKDEPENKREKLLMLRKIIDTFTDDN